METTKLIKVLVGSQEEPVKMQSLLLSHVVMQPFSFRESAMISVFNHRIHPASEFTENLQHAAEFVNSVLHRGAVSVELDVLAAHLHFHYGESRSATRAPFLQRAGQTWLAPILGRDLINRVIEYLDHDHYAYARAAVARFVIDNAHRRGLWRANIDHIDLPRLQAVFDMASLPYGKSNFRLDLVGGDLYNVVYQGPANDQHPFVLYPSELDGNENCFQW